MAQGGGINIGMLVALGTGILALANCFKSLKLRIKAFTGGIVFMLGPVIGGQMESTIPSLSATSEWNASYRARFGERSRLEGIQHEPGFRCGRVESALSIPGDRGSGDYGGRDFICPEGSLLDSPGLFHGPC